MYCTSHVAPENVTTVLPLLSGSVAFAQAAALLTSCPLGAYFFSGGVPVPQHTNVPKGFSLALPGAGCLSNHDSKRSAA
jgi:hypothetical protein